MIDKSVIDSHNSSKDSIMNVSCWNCVSVESDIDNTELSLSQIRKKQRRNFKLYSFILSEISKPKVVSTKQKVKENYAIGKKVEAEILKNTNYNEVSNKGGPISDALEKKKALIPELPAKNEDLESLNVEETTLSKNLESNNFDTLNAEEPAIREDQKSRNSETLNVQEVALNSQYININKINFEHKLKDPCSNVETPNKLILESRNFESLNVEEVKLSKNLESKNSNTLNAEEAVVSKDIESRNFETLTAQETELNSQYININKINIEDKFKDSYSNVETPNNLDKCDSGIFDEVLVKCSTPKPEFEQKNIDVISSLGTIENATSGENVEATFSENTKILQKGKDIEELILGLKNLSFTEKEVSVNEMSDKVDTIKLNQSEPNYQKSTENVKQLDMTEKRILKIDSKKTRIPLLKKTKIVQDFQTSLPILNTTQNRHNLKASTSLIEDNNANKDRSAKSLRWSTLNLRRKSSNNDEVYCADVEPKSHASATLPRRSNSPLPNDRDLLDSHPFAINKSGGLPTRSESMASVYSGAGEGTRNNVTVHGEVQISLLYNYRLGALEVGVKRCRELAPVDSKRNRSDPYVKVYLLPDKSKAGKRKTKVKKNTLNPVFEETLSFVQPLASLSARTLWLSVWHADMFGRNDFLGEVTLPLADVVFDDPAPMWYKLHERTEQFDEQQGSRGDLIVALKLDLHENNRGKGTLHVLVKEAKNLVATKPNGLADVFCKSYLLPERGRLAKQKTGVCSRTLNPKWEHTFIYRGISVQELSTRALELSLWDRDRLASNDFMGAIRLSLGTGTYMGASVNWMDSVGKEVSLWQRMLQQPNFWVENSLPLRPHLNN